MNRIGCSDGKLVRYVVWTFFITVEMAIRIQAAPVTTPAGLFDVNGNTITTGMASGNFTGVTVYNPGAATTLTLGQANGTALELDNNTAGLEIQLGTGSVITIQVGTTLKNTASAAAVSIATGTITSNGEIMGYVDGISTLGATTVNNTGQIYGMNDTSTPTDGASGAVLGLGSIVNNTGVNSLMSGYVNGVFISGAGSGSSTVSNQGSIAGFTNTGVLINGIGTVTNSGLIQGGGDDGVYINGAANVTNTGTISGINNGVEGDSTGTVTNSGQIYGLNDVNNPTLGNAGVFFHGDATITNQGPSSLIEGFSSGVTIGGAGTVTNSGSIASFTDGIDISGTANVTNTGGEILGLSGNGIFVGGDGTVINTTGTIQGGNNGLTITGTGNVTNSGAIYGANASSGPTSGNIGIEIGGDGTVTNQTGAIIAGYVNGLEIDGGGTLNNQGEIGGVNTAVLSDGVLINGAGSVTNSGAQAFIVGASDDGVFIGGDGSVTNVSGTIQGGSNGVEIDGAGNVTNSGSGQILGLDSSTNPNAGNDGILLGSGSVTNSGTESLIAGFTNGVEISGTGTITNSGTIDATNNAIIIHGTGASTVNNAGSIIAVNSTGVNADGMGNALSISNSGLIAGNTYGVYDPQGTITSLINTGTIPARPIASSRGLSIIWSTWERLDRLRQVSAFTWQAWGISYSRATHRFMARPTPSSLMARITPLRICPR